MRRVLALEIVGAVLGALCLFGSVFIWLHIGAAIMGVN
tara:strand:+ start:1642 stop:1755 length:114 start_codon:yes stop_codon:yes gene_type:complete